MAHLDQQHSWYLIFTALVLTCAVGLLLACTVQPVAQASSASPLSASATASQASATSEAAVAPYVATFVAIKEFEKAEPETMEAKPAWRTAAAMEASAIAALPSLRPRTPGAPLSPPSPTWDVSITDDSCGTPNKREVYHSRSCRVMVLDGKLCSIAPSVRYATGGDEFYFHDFEPCESSNEFAYPLPANLVPAGTDNLRIVSVIGSRVNLAPYILIHQDGDVIRPTVDARAYNPNIIASFDMATHQFIVQGTPVAVTPIVVTPIVVYQYRELVSPPAGTPYQ